MANLPEVGLQATIAGLPGFNAGAKAINSAYDSIEKKAENVSKATGRLGSAFSSITSPISAVSGQFVGLGNHLLQIGAIAGGAALAGVTALGAGLATFAVVGINRAIDLDAQMATIAATMNKTKEAVGPLKDLILDLALDPNLTVNTTQAADAIELLARNGVTMTEIMDGAAKSTVALANATGANFGTAADVASSVMRVFNIEAGNMETAIDGITGVVNTSKFTIDDYAIAFAQAAGVAEGMGVSIQDFNTVISGTSTMFGSGSDAGTSFKTMLQRLAAPTGEAKAEMEKYGISLFDAEGNMLPLAEVAGQLNSVFEGTATITSTVGGVTDKMAKAAENAGNKIPQLTTTIDQQHKKLQIMNDELGAINFHYGENSLRAQKARLAIENLTFSIKDNENKLSDYKGAITAVSGAQSEQITTTKTLTEAEKARLAETLGGADAARSVLALAGMTKDEFEQLSLKVNDTGQAFRSAATRVDSVKGAFEIFRGIIEAIQIEVGDKFLPLLRNITVGFTDLASKSAPMVVEFFGNIANLITDLIGKVTLLFDVFGEKGLAGVFASLGFGGSALFLKKLGELAAMMGLTGDNAASLGDIITTTLGGAFAFLTDNLFPMLTQAIEFIMVHFQEFKGAIIGIGVIAGAGIFATLIAGIVGLISPITLVIAAAALLGAAWAGNWGGIQEKTFAVWAVIQPILTQLVGWLQINIPVALQFLSDAWNNVLLPGIIAVSNFIMNTVIPLFSDFINAYIDITATRLRVLSDTWTNYLLPALTSVWSFIDTVLMPLWVSFINFLTAVAGVVVKALAGLWQNVLRPALVAVGDFIATQLQPAFDAIAKVISENVSPAANKLGGEVLPVLSKGLQTVIKWIKDATKFFNSLASAVRNFTLPPMLTPGSPPPFAIALADIAREAAVAAAAMNVFGQVTNVFGQATIDKLLGVNRAIASNNNAIGAARDDLEKFFDKSNLGGSKSKVALSVLTGIFRDHSDEILNATDRQAKFNEMVSKFGPNFEKLGISGEQGKTLLSGMGLFINFFDKRKAELLKAQQNMFIQAGKTALEIGNKLSDIVQGSIDILDTRVETLKGLVESGLEEVNFEGIIINQTQAQELLNAALAEQLAIQDDILQLKQNEQKLGFLEKQLALIDTLNEAGLNVKDILGGMTLGLGASIPDMIEATNRLVMAMIDQIDKDLQLASPSVVMFDKMKLATAGMVKGLLASIPQVQGAMRKTIGSIIDIPAGQMAGSSNHQNNYNNYFDMSVNTGASPQAVISQFEVMRAMA